MKNKLLFLVRILIMYAFLFFASCTANEDEQTSLALKDENIVTLNEALTAARQINNSSLVHDLAPSSNAAVTRDVSEYVAVPDAANPSYYVMNYKNGGYSIIAGDKRIEPVMAFSDSGYFEREGTLPSGLANWLSTNHDNVQKLRTTTSYEVPEQVSHLWKELLTATVSSTTPTPNTAPFKLAPPAPPCSDTYSSTVKGPYLHSQWGQGCNYNDLCPTGTYSCGHVPTGCVATSMSQIMNYWHFPTSYNWASMPANSGSSEVARLMSDAGVSVSMSYSDNGSGAYTSDVPTALKNRFGYATADFGNYNFSTVQSNLNSSRPIILSGFTDHDETHFLWWKISDNPAGEGHAWVCDGYQVSDYFYCDCSCGGSYSMLNMNWGWNESWSTRNYNGWYSQSNWTVTRTDATFNFQYFKQMVYNIHP